MKKVCALSPFGPAPYKIKICKVHNYECYWDVPATTFIDIQKTLMLNQKQEKLCIFFLKNIHTNTATVENTLKLPSRYNSSAY